MRACVLAALMCAATGCGDEVWAGDLPTPDADAFAAKVYPVMLRDCGFNDCHGGPSRFFQVFGPGRTRLDPMSKPEDPATNPEIATSYQRALSMIVQTPDEPIEQSLLLQKPLERSAGGVSHKGIDALGRNVYQSKLDPGYLALVQWASGLPVTAGLGGNGGAGGQP